MPAVLRVSGVQFKIKMAAITRAEENDLEVFFSQTILWGAIRDNIV